jgi:hypothetical protein
LFEQLDAAILGAKERSLIDRCTQAVYADFQQSGVVPTLTTLYDKLMA